MKLPVAIMIAIILQQKIVYSDLLNELKMLILINTDRKASLSIGDEIGKNVITCGVDMSSSTKINNRKKDLLILGNGPTQGLEHTLKKKLYSINFTKKNTKVCLSLHYNGANSYLFVNSKQIIKFEAKDSEILTYSLCLGNISKDWSHDNMKKNRI